MIAMPRGADILCIKEQGGKCILYALIDTGNPLITKNFEIVMTGVPVSEQEKSI